MGKMVNDPLKNITAFDANKVLKSNIDKLMDNVGTKGLCIPVAASYMALVKVINAFAAPVGVFKAQIIGVMDNNPVIGIMDDISKNLDILSTSLGKGPNLKISKDTIYALNIFNKACLDFNDILPNAMNRMIDDAMSTIDDAINYVTEGIEDITDFELPDDIVTLYDDMESFFKENALSETFDEIAEVVVSPIKAYRDFIKSSGIIEMIKRLQKFEQCLMNKNTCNRPKKEFYFPGTRKYNSQYYMDLFAINLKGEVELKKISKSLKKFESKVSGTFNKIDNFVGKKRG